MKKVAISIGQVSLSALIFGSVAYGYAFLRSRKNLAQYLQNINGNTLKDASRLTNQSFGISWGFQADDTVMNRIDSGDIIFLKYDCTECLSPESMIECHFRTFLLLDHEYHSAGFAYRDEEGLSILYNEVNETKCKKYCEMVSLPYIKELTVQKVQSKDLSLHKLMKEKINFQQQVKQTPIEFVNRMFRLLNLKRLVVNLRQLNSGDQKINIRTQTNRTLRSL